MAYKDPPKEHQFKKGNTRGGKTKGAFSLLNMLRAKIKECPEGEDKKTYAELIINKMMDESIKKGDIQHIKTIWNYLEGMPKGGIDFNPEGVTINFNVKENKK